MDKGQLKYELIAAIARAMEHAAANDIEIDARGQHAADMMDRDADVERLCHVLNVETDEVIRIIKALNDLRRSF